MHPHLLPTVLAGPLGPARDDALAQLHSLLLRAARFELSRRQDQLRDVAAAELEDLAVQAADDALLDLLNKLDDYRGASRFTTWAYKFAVLAAGVKARRRAWQGREPVLDSALEDREALAILGEAMRRSLTPQQQEIFTALALNAIPIDVLAEQRNTTRGALYQTLHDARRELRAALAAPTAEC